MQQVTYDERKNIEKLDYLPPRLRVVFALLCALRLLPAYHRFHARTGRGDPAALQGMVDKLWSDEIAWEMRADEAEKYSQYCLTLAPSEDEGWDPTVPYAEDAATAVAYAYRAQLTSNSQEAAWAGRVTYEATDHYIQTLEDIEPNDPDDELFILSHPVMQLEISRQNRDLADLAELAKHQDKGKRLQELRGRTEQEARTLFEVG